MMQSEFVDAFEAVACFRPSIGGTTWRVIHAFYQSRHLDPVCIGPERHERFARWVVTHENRVSRVVARIGRSESARREALEQRIASLTWQLHAIGTCALR